MFCKGHVELEQLAVPISEFLVRSSFDLGRAVERLMFCESWRN